MDHLLKNLGGVTLKSLLENPSLLQPTVGSNADDPSSKGASGKQEMDLEKKLKEVEGDFFSPGDFGAAFLGPNLWDKTYGDDDFKLEYMELDEFLSENGLPINHAEQQAEAKELAARPETSPLPEPVVQESVYVQEKSATATPVSPTPSEGSSESLKVDVKFELSPTDIALASIPGQDIYDPRTRSFSEEELKPQPMIKKSRKIYVPPEAKDEKYWDRRRKNNVAAKRSRDARRIKENQISMRAAFLEKENNALRGELMALKKENSSLMSIVKSYEQKYK
jgi:thyrotrophic embryonic factor